MYISVYILYTELTYVFIFLLWEAVDQPLFP